MFPKRLPGTFRSFALMTFGATLLRAQVPGVPVLQNGFSNPGMAIAANFGSGGGASYFGAAGGWGMGSGKLQMSLAAGVQRASNATRGAYGARVASNLWTSGGGTGSLGAGAFVGLGGSPSTSVNGVVNNPALMIVPVGVSLAYRHSMGTTRGFSAYASPMYRWMRATGDTAVSSGSVRVGLGLDIGFSSSFGATIGTELGTGGKSISGAGSTLGIAVTFVPGRR